MAQAKFVVTNNIRDFTKEVIQTETQGYFQNIWKSKTKKEILGNFDEVMKKIGTKLKRVPPHMTKRQKLRSPFASREPIQKSILKVTSG